MNLKKILNWLIFAILSIQFSTLGQGTETEIFYFNADHISLSITGRYGGHNIDFGLVNDVKPILPYIIGLDELLSKTKHTINISIGLFGSNEETLIEIDGEFQYKIKDYNGDFDKILKIISKKLGKKIKPVFTFKGFAIELSSLGDGKTAYEKLDQLTDRLIKLEESDTVLNRTMSIFSACSRTLIWIHTFSDGSKVIQYGIFKDKKSAGNLLKILKPKEKNAKVVPVELKIKMLEKYFGKC